MKKILLMLVCAALLTACGTPLDRFESFIEKTESECADYTDAEWEKNEAKFDKLVKDMEADKEEYSSEDMQKIGKLTARYMKLKMKRGMKSIEKVGSFMKGMMEGDDK